MTPDEIASKCLADEMSPLNAALALLEAFQPFSQSSILMGLGKFEGPLRPVLDAVEVVDAVFYVGDDPEWWHPDVRGARKAQREDAESRMRESVKAACRAILDFTAKR